MKLKILFLTHKFFPDIGGIEVNSEILAGAFYQAGHSVRLLTWSRDHSGKRFPYEVRRSPGIAEVIAAHRWADVVFENNPCMRLAWPSVFIRRTSVVAIRTWVCRPDGRIAWQDKVKLARLKRSAAVIAVSDYLRKECWPPAIVISNPYRTDTFVTFGDIKRDRYFVFLGRLVNDKGADLAIKALHKLFWSNGKSEIAGGDGYSLTIIGDGPFRPRLEKLAGSLGLSARIRFTGMLKGSKLVSCLNRHKYLLVPSLMKEPFGNVALEGMACGCIPIVSDGGGLPDAVGQAGLVFSRGDADSLAACIKSVVHDTALQAKLHRAAELHLAAHHPDIIAGKYLEVIQQAKINSSR